MSKVSEAARAACGNLHNNITGCPSCERIQAAIDTEVKAAGLRVAAACKRTAEDLVATVAARHATEIAELLAALQDASEYLDKLPPFRDRGINVGHLAKELHTVISRYRIAQAAQTTPKVGEPQ